MSLAQFSALTGGRKFKRPYVDEINARARYLPQLRAQERSDAYQDKMYDVSLQNLAVRQDALDAQKKAQKKANRLGYANLALGAGLSGVGLAKDMDWFKPDAAESVDVGTSLADPGNWVDTGPTPAGDLLQPQNMMPDPYGNLVQEGDILKNIGGNIGSGLYDSVVGNYLDFGDVGFDAIDYIGVGQF